MTPKIIDNIPCYSPELALSNTGYHPEALAILSNLEKNNFWYISRNVVLKIIFKKFLKSKICDVLEVGCGNGIVLSALSELKNLRLTGADIYLTGIKFAKTQVPGVNFIQINAEEIPFENSFDAVGCFDVLEHIENDRKVLTQLYKTLKRNSHLFITVPQYQWLWSEIDEIDRHKRRYSRNEIIEKVKKAGFAVQYVNCFAFAIFPLVLISRFSRKRKKENATISNSPVYYPEIQISPITNFILRAIMRIDEFCYRANIKIPFGSSILLVATKE